MKPFSRLRSVIWASDAEYRANLRGLNTFFGAVLGFVITGIERIEGMRFAVVLAVCSAIVMCILYVSESRNKWPWLALAILFIWALPQFFPAGLPLPPKLQPTLFVWLLLTLFVELAPRQKVAATPVTAEPA